MRHIRVYKKVSHTEGSERSVTENSDFSSVGKHLLKKSSIYAVSQVGNVESLPRRIWWTLVFVVGLSGSCYQIIMFLLHYFEYPVVVNIKLESPLSLDFPAVTVCNMNRIKAEFIGSMERNLPHHKSGFRVLMSERRSFASCSNILSGLKDKHADARLRFLVKYTTLRADDRRMFGYQLRDLIQHCSYDDNPCAEADFSFFPNLKYGNCFTFNRKMNASDIIKTSSQGAGGGLDLILNIDPSSYIDITPSFGARVILHDPSEDPNPEEEGINISPGFETSIGIAQKIVSRLPSPYRDHCIDYGNNEYFRGEHQKDCITICIQEQNFANCSCVDPTLPSFGDRKHCNMASPTDACCLDRLLDSMAVDGIPCECPLSCLTTKYDMRYSVALLSARSKDIASDGIWHQSDRNITNQANLKILYSKYDRIISEQNPMYENSQMFSNLGSLLSLWLGLSLFAAFELIENMGYLFRYCSKGENDIEKFTQRKPRMKIKSVISIK